MNRRLLILFMAGHVPATVAVYGCESGGGFISMCLISVFPLVGWAVWRQADRFGYQGHLNVLYVGMLLSAVGILMHYRVGTKAARFLVAVPARGGVPAAVNLAVFDAITLVVTSRSVFSGWMGRCLAWIEERTSYVYWGLVSLAAMALPLLTGGGVGRTKAWLWGASGQVSEFGFKVLFPLFLSKFLACHQREISLPGYPARELCRIFVVFLGLVSGFFLFPLVLIQREQGTALLMGLVLTSMVAFATRRWYAAPIGVFFICMAILGAALIDPHTKERIFGGWIGWERYVHHPFPATGRFPGWQIAKVRAVVESSLVYGRGLGNGVWGRIPEISSDFAIAPLVCELGVLGLAIVMGCYLLLLKEGLSGERMTDFRGFLRVAIPVTICCQGFFQIWAVLGISPLAGVPLPMISYGGSAAVCNAILLGVLTELGRPREVSLSGGRRI